MNKLDTNFTGGVPYYNDDFIFLTNYIKDFADNILARYATGGNPNFIISGCFASIINGVSGSVSAGYIYLNGEVLKVDAQTVAYSVSNTYAFSKQTTLDVAGERVTKNTGVEVNLYQINRAIVTNVTVVNTSQLSIQGATLQTKLVDAFASNTLIDHSAVSMIAGTGLTGGGTITATRTFNMDPAYAGFTNYYTKTNLNTSGAGGQVHWDNVTNTPAIGAPTDDFYTRTQLNTSGAGGQVHWNNVTNAPSIPDPANFYTKTELNTSGAGGAVHWANVTNKTSASTTVQGIVELATVAETETGTSETLATTPLGVATFVRTQESWITATVNVTGFIAFSGFVKYRKNKLGYLEIAILDVVKNSFNPSDYLLFTLPSGYRPITEQQTVVWGGERGNGADLSHWTLLVKTNGEVEAFPPNVGGAWPNMSNLTVSTIILDI